MRIVRMTEEAPSSGQKLGVKHTLKHYLNPGEAWDDLADDVPDNVRPYVVDGLIGRLEPPAYRQYERPGKVIEGHWEHLKEVHRGGYFAVTQSSVAELSIPPAPPWVRQPARVCGRKPRGPRYVTVARGGIFVSIDPRAYELKTAYRLDLKLRTFDGLKRDRRSRERRIQLSDLEMRKQVALNRPESDE